MREYAIHFDTSTIERKHFDVVVAGSGLAGLYAALHLDEGLTCALINKQGKEESNSVYAQGGIASVFSKEDSFESHFEDTITAGAGLCDEDAVRVLVQEGPEDIKRLMNFHVPFDKDEKGEFIVSMEGAHTFKRILHCGGDATGYHITKTLSETVSLKKTITRLNFHSLIDILTDENGTVCGVLTMTEQGTPLILDTKNVILATGGIGRIYRKSTNSSTSTGDGIAAAFRAGAALSNMEFVQFHPTALIHPDLNMRYFLISEALRGEGAVLRNRKWEPFMKEVHPLADLAPRDIVSRAIIREMIKHDLPNVYLDITFKPREVLQKRFPIIYNECMRRGVDIASNWIPVVPIQHYFMGGIKTDLTGKTSIEGLFACGECACTGIHGANRLASNSLLECLVFGRRAAEAVNGSSGRKTGTIQTDEEKRTHSQPDFETIRSNIRYTMTKKVGIIRNTKGMKEASAEMEAYYEQLKRTELNTPSEVEALNMATVALQVSTAAGIRKDSVGAHYREEENA